MKQCISKSQWKDLSTDQRHVLMERIFGCAPMLGHVFNPKITIGQMIQFLGEYCPPNMSHSIEKDQWVIIDDSDTNPIHVSKELCDALWEAVKAKLNTI